MRVLLSLFTPKRPPALRIKSVAELAPEFRPRWVKLRRIMIPVIFLYFCAFSLVLMPYAIHAEKAWLGAGALVSGGVSAGFAVFPIGASAVFGLLCHPFPRLAIWQGQFENWMQYDLDWDDQRK